jgi:methyl-accepting chemotaxis protein
VKITSMKMRLLVILLPFFLLSFGALTGVSYYFSQEALSQSVDKEAMAVSNDYSSRVQAHVNDAILHLDSFSAIKAIHNPTDQQQLVAALAECAKHLGALENVTYISPSGAAVRPNGTTFDLSERQYFKQVIATKKNVVSDVLLSKTTGKTSVNVAVPVFFNEQLTGVLTGTISMEKLGGLIADIRFQDTGYGVIADASGGILVHPRLPEVVGKMNFAEKKVNPELKLKETELDDRFLALFTAAAKQGQQVKGIYRFADGVTRIGVFTPIDLPGEKRWVMVVTAPEAEANQAVSSLTQAMLLGALVCLGLAIAFISIMSNRLAAPLTLIRDECLRLADGDLRERQAAVTSHDEIGQLAQGFQAMRTNLHTLVTKVLSQSVQLAAASEELTASAQQSAEAANQVAGSITQIAEDTASQSSFAGNITTVAQETAARTEQISLAAQDVNTIALTTSQAAEQGREAVARTVAQMNEIGRESAALEMAITELSKGSSEIGEIVTLISAIAKQTNLLALNAAIEAARAGEQGRGFAVVAEEVRKLAEESNQAAQKIGTLIQQNQLNMDQAVVAAQAGAEGIRTGISLVQATGETFTTITGDIFRLSDQIKGISQSISQMASSNQELVTDIEKIDALSKHAAAESQTVSAATEEQSASMQEVASSSQSLAVLANDLQTAAAKFTV